ncbi:MAG: phosphatase PAP2 family protein [Rhizobiaceae bacterium]
MGNLFLAPAFISEQRFLIATLATFIAIGTIFLPNPDFLTLPVIAQFIVTCTLPLVYAVVAHAGYRLAITRSLDSALDHTFKSILNRRNLSRAVPTIVFFAAFILTFPSFKSQIPSFNPYAWDPFFADMDTALHSGVQPWEIMNSIIGYGLPTLILDRLYYLWFPVIFMAIGVAVATPGNPALRERFMISFAACWIIIGVLCAIGFASVGPIFYDRLLGEQSSFAGLIGNLEAVNTAMPLNTLLVRENLWRLYVSQSNSVISGISAMPSMHNAICVLMFLAARHIHRYLAIAAFAYAVLIFLGSVHLGWHYAVDGYASAIMVALIWKAAGWQAHMPSVGFFSRKI